MNELPPYERIAAELRSEIESGGIPAGSKLPSVREICRRYKVSIATAHHAVSQLKNEGLVHVRRGGGAYVAERKPVRRVGPDRYARHTWQVKEVAASAAGERETVRQPGDQTQTVSLVPADEKIAQALGVEPGVEVYERARIVTRKGVVTHTMTSWYRREDVAGTPIVNPSPGIAGPRGGFAVLAERGLEPHEITEELFARMPTRQERAVLGIGSAEPVVELHRTTRTTDGRVVEHARGIHAASRFLWSYTYLVPD